jgi:hypothetical protein
MDEERDLDVSNYDAAELMEAVGLNGKPGQHEIADKVRHLVDHHSTTDPELAQFFSEAGSVLMSQNLAAAKTTAFSRIINVDSYYRENLAEPLDDFNCTLSEPLVGVTSLSLLSIEVPQTWYSFSQAKGTNVFVFQTLDVDNEVYTKECSIPEGNYSNIALLIAVENALNEAVKGTAYFLDGTAGPGPWFGLTQDPVNGLATLTFSASFPSTIKITWYDPNFPSLAAAKLNCNLGWDLGFRYMSTALEPGSAATSLAVVSAASSVRYLILKLNDHTSNRLTNNIVSLRTFSNQHVRLPLYTAKARIASKLATNTVESFPSAPRRLTSKQLFTISSVSTAPLTQRGRVDGADTTDYFAKIPIKHQSDWANTNNGVTKLKEDGPGKLFVEMGGTLQKNKRVYFGPVTLRKLGVSLYDDRGNLLGLNQNWSFTLEATFS